MSSVINEVKFANPGFFKIKRSLAGLIGSDNGESNVINSVTFADREEKANVPCINGYNLAIAQTK